LLGLVSISTEGKFKGVSLDHLTGEIIERMILSEAYDIAPENGKFALKLKSKAATELGRCPSPFDTQADAAAMRDELLAWIRWLDGSGCEDGVSKAATVTRAGRPGPTWQGLREESGDAGGQQGDDRRVQDDDDEYGARDDGGRRSAVACLCDAPKVLHLVFARADRVANETFVASIMRPRVVLHLVEPTAVARVSSHGSRPTRLTVSRNLGDQRVMPFPEGVAHQNPTTCRIRTT